MSTGERQELRLLATMWDDGDSGSIRLTERYPAGVDEVWNALTERDRLAVWLGEFDGDLRLGGEFHSHFYASGAEGRAQVTACTPLSGFVIADRSASETEEEMRIRLTADGEYGSRLELEHRGLPLEWIAAYAAGTQIHFEDLGAHLAGGGRCDSDARMAELHPAYLATPVRTP